MTTVSRAAPRTRGGTATLYLVPGVLLLSLVFVRAPALYGDQAPLPIYALSLLPFALAIGVDLLLVRADWQMAGAVALAGVYVSLVIVAAFRGASLGAISINVAWFEAFQFSLLAGLAMVAFLRDPHQERRARNVQALCWAPVMFVAVNVALHFAGFVPGEFDVETQLPSTMLGIVGIEANRVQFPLASGLNGIGPTAVVALVVCAVLALRRERRGLALAGLALSLYVVLAIDSRGALLFAVLAVALVWATPRARKRGLGWMAIALPVVPVVLILALSGLVETEAGAALERGGRESLSTGTGRTVVWGDVIQVFRTPKVEHVLGYGQNGQITSGASVQYAYLFAREANPLSHSAHNVLLQALLDTGWSGLVCLLALVAAVLSRLGRRWDDPYFAALLAAVISLLLLGVVQAAPTPVQPDSFAFWLLTIFAVMRLRAPAS